MLFRLRGSGLGDLVSWAGVKVAGRWQDGRHVPGITYVSDLSAFSICPTLPAFLVMKSSYMANNFGGCSDGVEGLPGAIVALPSNPCRLTAWPFVAGLDLKSCLFSCKFDCESPFCAVTRTAQEVVIDGFVFW